MSVTKDKKKSSRELRSKLAKGEKIAKSEDSIIRKGDMVEERDGVKIYDVTSDIYKRKERVPSIEEGDFMFFDVIDIVDKEDGKAYWGYVNKYKKVQKKDQARKIKEMEHRIADKKEKEEERKKYFAEQTKKYAEREKQEREQALEKLKPFRPLINEIIEAYKNGNLTPFDYDVDDFKRQYAVTHESKDGKGYAIVFSDIKVKGFDKYSSNPEGNLVFGEVFIDEINIDDIETGDFKKVFENKNQETIKAFQPIFDLFYDKIYDKLGQDLEIEAQEYAKGGEMKMFGGGNTSGARNLAMRDVNGWDDKEVSEYLGIKESEVDANARVTAIDKRTEYYMSIGNLDEFEKGGSMASGGGVGNGKQYKNYNEFISDNIGKKVAFSVGNSVFRYPFGGATKEYIEEKFKSLVWSIFWDADFFYNYAYEYEEKGEIKRLVGNYYNLLITNPKVFTEFWTKFMDSGMGKTNVGWNVGDANTIVFEAKPINSFFAQAFIFNKLGASNSLKEHYKKYGKEWLRSSETKEGLKMLSSGDSMAKGGRTKAKYKIGQVVKVASSNDNDGYDSFRNRPLKIVHVATSKADHPGYDAGMEGMGLYDFVDDETGESIGSSLYDYELEYYAEGGEFAKGGRAGRPSPSDSATMYPVGHQQRGNDGNWWEIRADVRGVHSWKKINAWQVKQAKPIAPPVQAPAPVAAPIVAPKQALTDLQEELLSKGFINDDLTLTNKGKRVVELHKFCFPMEAHPFSHVYQTFDYFYPNRNIVYVAIDKVPMYTGTLDLYEAGTHLPDTLKDLAVHNHILEQQIQLSKSNRVEFKPYAYCPGIGDNETGLGFFLFANFVNNNEIYIDSAIFNYVNKHYKITRWEADASKAPLIYGYNGKNLQVVIQVKKKVIGLNDVIGLFDRQKTMDAITSKNPEVAIRGEKMSEFTSKSKPKVKEKKELSEEVKQAIAGLELMLEEAETEEEKNLYQQEIDKLKA